MGKYKYLILEITRIKEVFTKKNEVMAFLTCEDEFTDISVTLFPDVYKENNNLEKCDIIKVYGKIEKRNDELAIVASKIIKLN